MASSGFSARSQQIKQVSTYLVCGLILGVEFTVVGLRLLGLLNPSSSPFEVCLAAVTVYGLLSADTRLVVESLSNAKAILNDCLPRHVVDSLMEEAKQEKSQSVLLAKRSQSREVEVFHLPQTLLFCY
jgi:hypothetical protein